MENEQIKEAYLGYVLSHHALPNSLAVVAEQEDDLDETTIKEQYPNPLAIERALWLDFFHETTTILFADTNYYTYSMREKLLAFYYTLLQVLTPNRVFVELSVGTSWLWIGLSPLSLKVFQKNYLEYIKGLLQEGERNNEVEQRLLVSNQYANGLWLQALFILKFWANDSSEQKEQTDLVIEKGVNFTCDMLARTPLDSGIELAKFLLLRKKH